jgi:ATP-binding cassette, subfamily B, bacterial
MVAELWRAEPWLVVGFATCLLVSTGVAVALVFTTGSIVGSLPAAVAAGAGSDEARHIRLLVVLLGALLAVQQVVAGAQEAVVPSLARRFEGRLRERVMGAALAPPGVLHLHDPVVANEIAAATTVGTARFGPAAAVTSMPAVLGSLLTGLTMAVVVGTYRWWVGGLLGAAWLYARAVRRRDVLEGMRHLGSQTLGTRRQGYFRALALTPHAAKEIRVFGLGTWIVDAFHRQWTETMQDVWSGRREHRPALLPMIAVLGAANVVAFAAIADGLRDGQVGLRGAAVLLQAAIAVSVLADPGGVTVFDMTFAYGASTVAGVGQLEATLGSTDPAAPGSVGRSRHDVAGATAPSADRIRFVDVTFRYPGADRDVLSGLDLELAAGRSLAIVGENGAGKTTLVKLLCGLIAPTGGAVTVDGHAMSELEPDGWRARMAVVFQDFARFQASARDNVALGAVDVPVSDEELDDLAARAGLTDIIRSLPDGWATPLTRQLDGGTDLSGGEWQRIALARAMLSVRSGATILVLDEPTANLDVRAEAAFYDRFLDLTTGLTTVVISHRFATVRRADTIAVLAGGTIAELGSHAELMARDGTYARLFRLQAAGFEPTSDEATHG